MLNRNTSRAIDDITGGKESPKYYRGLFHIRELAMKNRDKIDLMKIREMENTDMFRTFVHFCLQHTRSKIDWQYERQDVRISNFFSVFDEAFIILLMMNSWDEFELVAKGENIPRGNRKTLFTNCSVDSLESSSNGSSDRSVATGSDVRSRIGTSVTKKIKGWSVRGIERYNDIIKHVYKMRQKQEQKDMENIIMREYSTLDESKKRKRKRDESDLETEIEVDAFDAYNFDPTAL